MSMLALWRPAAAGRVAPCEVTSLGTEGESMHGQGAPAIILLIPVAATIVAALVWWWDRRREMTPRDGGE